MEQVIEMIDHDHAFQPRIIIEDEVKLILTLFYFTSINTLQADPLAERALDAMVDPMEEESRKEEEKKRETIGVLKGEFYEVSENKLH